MVWGAAGECKLRSHLNIPKGMRVLGGKNWRTTARIRTIPMNTAHAIPKCLEVR